jgi:prepilin-type N-terminal cleavage/methylation domain-containing protein
MRKQHGFTLIELLIVLAILGILVGIVAMSIGDLNATAVARGKASEREIVLTSMDAYVTQDVTAGPATMFDARAVAARIYVTDTATPFTKYLRRDTKYAYTWTVDAGFVTLSGALDP